MPMQFQGNPCIFKGTYTISRETFSREPLQFQGNQYNYKGAYAITREHMEFKDTAHLLHTPGYTVFLQ